MSRHPLADLSALVDGELDHAARDRTLAHLASCQQCRADVEAQRRVKARLRAGLGHPGLSSDLTDRLLALVPVSASVTRPAGPPVGPPLGPRRPPGVRLARGGSRRPGERGSRWPRRAVGGAVLAIGLGAVLAVGGARGGQMRAPVDPSSDVFVVDFNTTTAELPLPDPAGVASIAAR